MNAEDSFIKIDDNTEISIDVSGAGVKVNVECGTDIDTITIGGLTLVVSRDQLDQLLIEAS